MLRHTHELSWRVATSVVACLGLTAGAGAQSTCGTIDDLTPIVSGAANDILGRSVDIFEDRAVFGAPGAAEISVARWDAGNWLPLPLALGAPAGTSPGSRFGASVSLAGDLLAVGAPLALVDPGSGPVPSAGFVAIFRWNGTEFRYEYTLTQPDLVDFPAPEVNAAFGYAVDLWHDAGTDTYRLIVGATGATSLYEFSSSGFLPLESGRAFILTADGQTPVQWTLEAALDAPDYSDEIAYDDLLPGDVTQDGKASNQDRFGAPVAIDDSVAVVGGPSRGLSGPGAEDGIAAASETTDANLANSDQTQSRSASFATLPLTGTQSGG